MLTIYIQCMYYARARTFKTKLRNRYNTCTCIILRGVLTSVLQESQGLITYAFVMLPLAMISLHMLTFRLMVTMVAEFCSLVILIHNTLLGEITIRSNELQGLILYLYYLSFNDTFPHAKMQDHWFYGY